jgi:hypothetical protein
MPEEFNELELLARKYGTDKRSNDQGQDIYHGYMDTYYKLFKDKKFESLNMLEIGVQNGWSIFAFRDFFPSATIYGIDDFSDVNCKTKIEDIESDRVKILVSDQTDEKKINDFFGDTELSIIIDDCSHMSNHQQLSFKFLFPRLKSQGYYIIEDLAVCYNRNFREFDDERSSTLKWLELIQNNLPFSYYIDYETMSTFINQIESITFEGELGIIKKL